MLRWWVVTCAFILSSVAVAQTQPAAGALVPIEQFTRHDEFGVIKLAPDNEYIAFTTGKYGRTKLFFRSLEDAKRVSGIQAPEGFEILDFEWVSATRVIYFIAQRQPGVVRASFTGEIFAIDRDGKQGAQIYGYRAGGSSTGSRLSNGQSTYATPELLSTLKSDDRYVLIAEYPWIQELSRYRFNPEAQPVLVRLDVYTGKKTRVGFVPLRRTDILLDSTDQVRFAAGYNADFKQTALWKPQPDADWQPFELPKFREGTIRLHQLTTDDKAVLMTGVREGESLAALYRIDLQSQAVEKLFQHPEADVAGLITDLKDESAVGVRVYADKPELHWLSDTAPTAQLYKMLERAFPGQAVEVSSKSANGNLLLVFVSSDVNPGEYYLFDTQKKKADFLLAAKSWIDPQVMRPKEIVSIKARDGLTLHGYLTRPATTAALPLVVLPHGGPHGVRDDWSFDWEAQLLASRGYAVLQVNYRGSGGYGLEFESAGYRQWGAKMQDDLTDATRWAISNGVANSDRICIYGASYGGYAALMGAVREPKLYRCAIGYVGVYDLELMLTAGDIPESRLGRNYLDRVLGSDQAELRERSPAHQASRIEIPVLLVHGKEDVRADYQHAKRMKAALEGNQKSLEWLALSGEQHGVYDEETRREVYEKLLAFLERNLSPSSGAAAP
jgi:dipeptidyl aminopeptidase/acylaminoacyl peptidase